MAVILGLPWLAAVLGSLFMTVVTFLATYVTKRIAIIVAAMLALSILTAAFIGLIEGLTSAFSYQFPGIGGLGMVIPADFPALLSAYIAARIAFWVYSWNIKIIQMKLF